MIELSIVIVSWNAKDFLLECLESLQGQAQSLSLEIIVVDNASYDGSAEAAKNRFPEIILIENDANFGFAKANNIALKRSQGRYVCLINSDVKLLDSSCLNEIFCFMESEPRIAVLGPRILNPDMTLQYSCRKFPSVRTALCRAFGLDRIFSSSYLFSGEELFCFSHDEIRSVDAVSGCFLVVRREAMKQVGLLDERFFIYSEDVDWCRRFHEAGWNVVFYPMVQAVHHGGGSSKNSPLRFSVEQDRAVIQYYRKYCDRYEITIILIIISVKHFLRALLSVPLGIIIPTKKDTMWKAFRKHVSSISFIFKNELTPFKQSLLT